MKHILLTACVGMFFSLTAQKTIETRVVSEIKKVKLFLTSGEMTHQASLKLLKGRNRLVFTGVSAYADPQSIQFSMSANYKLVSFSTEMDFLAAEQFNPRISKLKDSLNLLKDQVQLNSDINNSFQAELAVLNTNRDLKGSQTLTVAQIKEAAEYYRTRTLEINKQVSKLHKESYILNEKIELIRLQLTELNFNENQRSNQVIILIDNEEAIQGECALSYIVSDCGWVATYDLSASDINQPINLKYKAKVYNNTGNDWNNIDLTLSTADPRLSATQPELSPWYLNYYDGYSKRKSSYIAPQSNVNYDYRQEVENNLNIANQRAWDNYMLDSEYTVYSKNEEEKTKVEQMRQQKNRVQMEQIEISELTAEFQIPSKFSCPTDGKPYVVDVKEMNINATFSYITIPKLDHGAFLLANIVGWQDLDLIPGQTNVYFGGKYVGVSEIDTKNVSDTLSLSFGRDSKVTVMRKLKTELSSKKVVGSSKKESFMYEIAIRNNRNIPIKITVYDQVPVSKNTDITVTADEISDGLKNTETGEVKWEASIQPTDVKTYLLGYTVKYPKDAQVVMQKTRTAVRAKF